jgi:hypothetical protein
LEPCDPHLLVFPRSPPAWRDPDLTPSCSFALLQGSTPDSSARHLSMRAPLLGISCRSAHPFLRVHITPEVPSSRLGSASRVSHPLCGLLLPGLASLFHPANALRLLPSGVSPSKELRQLFAGSLPSCRCSRVALPPSRKWVLWRTVRSASSSGASAFGSTSRLCSP